MGGFSAPLTSVEIYQGCRTPSVGSVFSDSSSEPIFSPSSSAREIYEGWRTPDWLPPSPSQRSADRLSIEEVQKIQWSALDDKMERWIQAVESIFGGSDSIKEICFEGSDSSSEPTFSPSSSARAIYEGWRAPDWLPPSPSQSGVDRLSIEEVQKIEWSALDVQMKRWIQALKIVVRVLLVGEKRLCESIFGGSHPIKEICFVKTAKGSLMQVLNFAEAIAISRRSSEKLFRILDMYNALAELMPDLRVKGGDKHIVGGPHY